MRPSSQKIIDLITHGQESDWLDFKAEMYSNDDKVRLLKDLMAMANSIHHDSKFIITGVKLTPDGARELLGIRPPLPDDAQFQQLVLSNIEPDLKFLFYNVSYSGKLFGVFEVLQENKNRPYMIKKSYGGKRGDLRPGECWIRKGSQQSPALRSDFNEMYYNSPHVKIRIVEGYFFGGEDSKGASYGYLPIQVANYSTNIPVTFMSGTLFVYDHVGREVTHHRVYGFDTEYKGADYHLYVAPAEERTGELVVDFGSTHCLQLGLDEFGHSEQRFDLRLEFVDSNEQLFSASYTNVFVHAKGDALLWKVRLSKQNSSHRKAIWGCRE